MFKAGVNPDRIAAFIIQKIDTANIKDKLTIIDRYFFSNGRFGVTKDLIAKIDRKFKARIRMFEIVTSKNYCDKEKCRQIRSCVGDERITIINENGFHDRFWIIDEKTAFVVGASINGFGKKHFFIQDDFLSEKDTEAILSIYRTKK